MCHYITKHLIGDIYSGFLEVEFLILLENVTPERITDVLLV
jgi:hypothetical protein